MQKYLDGLGWAPIPEPYEQEKLIQRIQSELFAEECQQIALLS